MTASVLVCAVWGVLGAVANQGVVFLEASRRVKGWPWAEPQGPGGGVYAVSIVVNLVIAGLTSGAADTAHLTSNGLIAFGIGATAPVVVKKVSRYVESLLPSRDCPDEQGGDADDQTTSL